MPKLSKRVKERGRIVKEAETMKPNYRNGLFLFFGVVIYSIIWALFYQTLSTKFNILLWLGEIVLVIALIKWIGRNTAFFRKSEDKKLGVEEKSIVLKILVPLGYVLGILLILGGIFSFAFQGDFGFGAFVGSFFLGVIILLIVYFSSKTLKYSR